MRWHRLVVWLACVLASAASATEIALEFDQRPVFALEGPGGSDMGFARYVVDGVHIEIAALGPDTGFGYVDAFGADPGENVADRVHAEGHLACGNQSDCDPFVASFSIALDAVGVDFIGVGDFSGASIDIFSAGFFLEAWSGPNGTGTLLASVGDPGGAPMMPRAEGGFLLPASLSLLAPGIRSIVFGASALTDEHVDPVNLSIVDRIRMTPTPEPGTAALLALGLGAVALQRRRALAGRIGRAGEIRTLDLQTPSLAR